MIKNIKLIISYDGSNFNGFQGQVGKRTVQEEIEKAIKKVTGRDSRLVYAGRTDSGVHAVGQVANFLTISNIPPQTYKYHLNKFLPDDIFVVDSSEVDLNFHSRFSAKKKKYRYIISNQKFMYPFFRNYKANVSYDLNIDRMKEACLKFVGTHDFISFMKFSEGVNTVRTIDSIDIFQENDIYIDFVADSFLHNQVRIMVGAIVNVGRGLWEPDYIEDLFKIRDREKSAMTFPSQGLYLMEIKY